MRMKKGQTSDSKNKGCVVCEYYYLKWRLVSFIEIIKINEIGYVVCSKKNRGQVSNVERFVGALSCLFRVADSTPPLISCLD